MTNQTATPVRIGQRHFAAMRPEDRARRERMARIVLDMWRWHKSTATAAAQHGVTNERLSQYLRENALDGFSLQRFQSERELADFLLPGMKLGTEAVVVTRREFEALDHIRRGGLVATIQAAMGIAGSRLADMLASLGGVTQVRAIPDRAALQRLAAVSTTEADQQANGRE